MNTTVHIVLTIGGIAVLAAVLLPTGARLHRHAVRQGDRIAARNRALLGIATLALLSGGEAATWLPSPWDLGGILIALLLTFALRDWFDDDLAIHPGRTHQPHDDESTEADS